MAIMTPGGTPNYSGSFIPEIWSGKIVENFYKTTVLAAITNTDYEGEIKDKGDIVQIRTMPETVIRDYLKDEDFITEFPESKVIQLLIDKGKYFSLGEYDVDRVQSDLNLMDMFAYDASERFKIAIDREVIAGLTPEVSPDNQGDSAGVETHSFNLGTAQAPVELNPDNVIAHLINMGLVLTEQQAPPSNRFVVISPHIGALIKKSELKDASLAGDKTSMLRNGRLGMIDNLEIFESQNLLTGSNGEVHILCGLRQAATFAMQMKETRHIEMEKRAARKLESFAVYGYKMVKPEAIASSVVVADNNLP